MHGTIVDERLRLPVVTRPVVTTLDAGDVVLGVVTMAVAGKRCMSINKRRRLLLFSVSQRFAFVQWRTRQDDFVHSV